MSLFSQAAAAEVDCLSEVAVRRRAVRLMRQDSDALEEVFCCGLDCLTAFRSSS